MPFNWIGHRHQQRVVSIPKIRRQSISTVECSNIYSVYNSVLQQDEANRRPCTYRIFCNLILFVPEINPDHCFHSWSWTSVCGSRLHFQFHQNNIRPIGIIRGTAFVYRWARWVGGEASVRIVRMHSAKLKPNSRVNNYLATNRTTLLCFSCGNLYSGQLVLNLHMLSSGAI